MLPCSTHSGVTCHPSAAAKQRAGPATQQTQLWFHGQTWAHSVSRHLAVEEPPEFGYELHRRRQLIALTARAHQQPIHKYRVLISLFGPHNRQENQGLIPFANISPPLSSLQPY